MLSDRGQRSRLVIGLVIIVLGVMALINNWVTDDSGVAWLWIVVLAGAAVAFAWIYRTDGELWAAIGAYVTGAVAVLILLLTQLNLSGVLVPVLVLVAIGVPFVYAWWQEQRNWGLLVPAYVLFAIALGLFLLEALSLPEDFLPAYVMLAIGAPFIVAYVVNRQWPFLIPGGILVIIGLFFLLGSIEDASRWLSIVLPLVVIVVGLFLLVSTRFFQKEKRE